MYKKMRLLTLGSFSLIIHNLCYPMDSQVAAIETHTPQPRLTSPEHTLTPELLLMCERAGILADCCLTITQHFEESQLQYIHTCGTAMATMLKKITQTDSPCLPTELKQVNSKINELGILMWPFIDKMDEALNLTPNISPLIDHFLHHFNYVITVYNANINIHALYLLNNRGQGSHAYIKNETKSLAFLPLPEYLGNGPFRLIIDIKEEHTKTITRQSWLISFFSMCDLELQMIDLNPDHGHKIKLQHVFEHGDGASFYTRASGRIPTFIDQKQL